jgi:hypothetical protein
VEEVADILGSYQAIFNLYDGHVGRGVAVGNKWSPASGGGRSAIQLSTGVDAIVAGGGGGGGACNFCADGTLGN